MLPTHPHKGVQEELRRQQRRRFRRHALQQQVRSRLMEAPRLPLVSNGPRLSWLCGCRLVRAPRRRLSKVLVQGSQLVS